MTIYDSFNICFRKTEFHRISEKYYGIQCSCIIIEVPCVSFSLCGDDIPGMHFSWFIEMTFVSKLVMRTVGKNVVKYRMYQG